MAKVFMQSLPSPEEFESAVSHRYAGNDSWALYSNLVFMKVATELENHFDNFLAPHNLSSGRFTLLMLLDENPAGLMPSELSHMVGVTQATISGLINGLEKAELVKRETHERDGRSFVIKLTDKGQNLIRYLIPLWLPKVVAFWGDFSSHERPVLSEMLDKMLKKSVGLNK